jgi:hypothetical protein
MEPERGESIDEFPGERIDVDRRRRPQRDVGADRGLPYLVLQHLAVTADRRAEEVRMHLDTGVDEGVVAAAFDVSDPASSPRARVRLIEHRDFVGELVADERQCMVDSLVISSFVAGVPGVAALLLASRGS